MQPQSPDTDVPRNTKLSKRTRPEGLIHGEHQEGSRQPTDPRRRVVAWDRGVAGRPPADPGPSVVVGQVINFGRDQEQKFVLARSWAHFLEDVADELERGKFVIAGDEGY